MTRCELRYLVVAERDLSEAHPSLAVLRQHWLQRHGGREGLRPQRGSHKGGGEPIACPAHHGSGHCIHAAGRPACGMAVHAQACAMIVAARPGAAKICLHRRRSFVGAEPCQDALQQVPGRPGGVPGSGHAGPAARCPGCVGSPGLPVEQQRVHCPACQHAGSIIMEWGTGHDIIVGPATGRPCSGWRQRHCRLLPL